MNIPGNTRIPEQYLAAFFEETIPKAGKSPDLARRIAQSLARNAASAATLATIAADAAASKAKKVTDETVSTYIQEFRRNYFVEELRGWDAPERSKTRLRTKPKRCLADASLAAALLGVGAERLTSDGQLFGLPYETLAVHDVIAYARSLPGYTSESVRYYGDSDGLEVDIIIELADGRWAGIVVKLGESKAAEGLDNLERLKKGCIESGCSKPATGLHGSASRERNRSAGHPWAERLHHPLCNA